MKPTAIDLTVDGDRIRATAAHPAGDRWEAWARYVDPADAQTATGDLVRHAPGGSGARVTITIARPPAQWRRLADLPPVKPKELGRLVAHQAGRYFRRKGRPLVTAARWVEGRAVAQVAAVDGELAQALVSGVADAGAHVHAMRPADGSMDLSLLPPDLQRRRRRFTRRRARRLATVAAVGWVGVLTLLGVRLTLEGRAVTRELARLEEPLALTRAARARVGDAATMVAALKTGEAGFDRLLEQLAGVAGALDRQAFVTQLEVEGDSVHLVGIAPDRAAVTAGLRAAGWLVREGPDARERAGTVFDLWLRPAGTS